MFLTTQLDYNRVAIRALGLKLCMVKKTYICRCFSYRGGLLETSNMRKNRGTWFQTIKIKNNAKSRLVNFACQTDGAKKYVLIVYSISPYIWARAHTYGNPMVIVVWPGDTIFDLISKPNLWGAKSTSYATIFHNSECMFFPNCEPNPAVIVVWPGDTIFDHIRNIWIYEYIGIYRCWGEVDFDLSSAPIPYIHIEYIGISYGKLFTMWPV